MRKTMCIAVIGDFDGKRPSHVATHEALQHAAEALPLNIDIRWLGTQVLESDFEKQDLGNFDAIWGASGVPESSPGVMNAICFAREKGVPFVGT